jgi:site-specific DNA-cytosine methylase
VAVRGPGYPAAPTTAQHAGRLRALLVTNAGNQPNGHPDRSPVQVEAEDPSPPVTAQFGGRVRALLVHGSSTMELRGDDEPSATVMATVHEKAARPRAFLVEQNANDTSGAAIHKDGSARSGTVRTGINHVPRAFVVDCQEAGQANAEGERGLTVRAQDEPFFTTSATMLPRRPSRAYAAGRVVQMTPRCLARFQSLPDAYRLPGSATLACTIIGNGCPTLLMQRVYEHVLRQAGLTTETMQEAA